MFENRLVISSYSFNFWISSSGSSVAVDTCSSERPIDRRRRAVASFSFSIPFAIPFAIPISIPFFSSNFLVAYISRIFLMSSSYSSSSSRESLRRSPISANLRDWILLAEWHLFKHVHILHYINPTIKYIHTLCLRMLVEQWQLEVHNTHPVGHSLACLQIGKHQVGTKLL